MHITSKIIEDGISISVHDKNYSLKYPLNAWKSYPDVMKDFLNDNFSYLKILPTAIMFNETEVTLNTSSPLFQFTFYQMMLNHLPYSADYDNINISSLIKKFMNTRFNFKDYNVKFPQYQEELNEKAIINFTFGKESLLTYAVSHEIGLPSTLVYVEEPDVPLEINYRKQAKERFYREFKVDVTTLYNETALLRNPEHFNLKKSAIGDGQIITEYCLAMMPLTHYYRSKYILFGNENSCNQSYISKEGFIAHPVFDQTHRWMIELNNIAQQMTNHQAQVVSLVESLYELAILKILHSRYTEIGKYQMSCFPDDNEYGKNNYWCHHCSKCARVFILLLANNIDPKRVGFTENMLGKDFKDYFSLFSGSKNMTGWDKNCGRDEQLYSFYLAYKNGAKGYLIDKFKEQFLKDVTSREDEFFKKFFSIYDTITIPKKIKSKVTSIYKEELN